MRRMGAERVPSGAPQPLTSQKSALRCFVCFVCTFAGGTRVHCGEGSTQTRAAPRRPTPTVAHCHSLFLLQLAELRQASSVCKEQADRWRSHSDRPGQVSVGLERDHSRKVSGAPAASQSTATQHRAAPVQPAVRDAAGGWRFQPRM